MIEPMTAARKLSVDDLLALGEDVRAELIDGEVVYKALPSTAHSLEQGAVMGWLRRRFCRKPGGRWPGGWLIGSEAHVVYEPHQVYCHDLVGWRRENMPEIPTGWAHTRPDWVCEILSPGHEKRDLVDKLTTLQLAGVPYYWIVDLAKRELLLHHLERERYVVHTARPGETIFAPPFEASELRSAILFGDEDDEE